MMLFNDIGKLVGRYFQALAWLSIASMIVRLFFFQVYFDFTFILLFWAAHHLIRHNATARKWTIGITGFCVGGITLGLIYAFLAGTDGMAVTLGNRTIENPSIGQIATVAVPFLVVAGVPLVLLVTPKAGREFSASSSPPLMINAGEG